MTETEYQEPDHVPSDAITEETEVVNEGEPAIVYAEAHRKPWTLEWSRGRSGYKNLRDKSARFVVKGPFIPQNRGRLDGMEITTDNPEYDDAMELAKDLGWDYCERGKPLSNTE